MAQDDTIPSTTRSLPHGIGPRHIENRSGGWGRSLLKYIIIGIPLLAALVGLLGGTGPQTTRFASSGARITVETPRILRSGNWFETRVIIEPAVNVADLTIAIDQPLWRQMSIDTLIPDADKVESENGRFTYSFGPILAGQRFVLKLDGQIQPHWLRLLDGRIVVSDGERRLVSAPLSIMVLP